MNTQKYTYDELLNKVKQLEMEIEQLKTVQHIEQQNFFQLLFNDSVAIKLIIDFETGQIVDANKAACTFYGYSIEELTLLNINQINALSPELVKQEMLNAKNEKRTFFTFKHKLKNGQIKNVEVSSGKIELDDKILLYSVIFDVTDRKLLENKLVETEIRFRKIFENMHSGVAIYKPVENGQNFIFVDFNKSAENITKVSKQELIGKTLLEKFPLMDKSPLFKALQTVNETGNDAYLPPFYYKDNQREGWRENYIYKLSTGEIVAIFSDVTERKNAEIKLQNQNVELIKAKEKAEESDRLKSAFLQNLSHEIRTPLNAICGFSGMLNKPELSEEKRKSFTSIIQTSSNQLLSIVSDILTISSLETKQEKINIDKVCVNNIIIDLLSIFKQQTKNQTISLYAKQALSDKQSEIYTDKTKITQILSNLISNALKFTHEGFIEFGYNLKSNELEFYVKDSGIGIKPELQEKIFERFRQADLSINKKYGGTGLGLSISKGFAELLGGKIWVNSEIDKGSTFYFTIPYKPVNEAVTKIDNNQETQKQTNNKPIILVAEDEEFNFLYIEELLIEFDYQLIHAKDGQETVDIFKTNLNISLILMDIKMPIMDGHTAAKIIKEQKPNLPIVAQSAYALEHEIERFVGIFDDYLTKPINETDLKQKILKYVNNQENKLLSNDRQV